MSKSKKNLKKKSSKKAPTKKKKAVSFDHDLAESMADAFDDLEAQNEIAEYSDDDFFEPVGLTLGQRIGTIKQLEVLDQRILLPLAEKAGLKIRLEGSKIRFSDQGEAMTVAEVTEIAHWLLSEVEKAMEAYDLDIS